MHWKTKANIQQLASWLPSRLSDRITDWLVPQREDVMRSQPLHDVASAAYIGQLISAHGQRLEGATCLEVGSGKRLSLSIGLWVLGAKKIVSIDQRRQIDEKLILNDISYMQTHQDQFCNVFQHSEIDRERLDRLFHIDLNRKDLNRFIEQCGRVST